MSSEKKGEAGNPQRWWESYLVRYFLGSIVGMICVIVLVAQVDSDITSLLKVTLSSSANEKGASLLPMAIGLILFGLAYCYAASSPITVLHSARMLPNKLGRLSRAFWFGWICTLIISMSHLLFGPETMLSRGLCGVAILPAVTVLIFIAARGKTHNSDDTARFLTLLFSTLSFAVLLSAITQFFGHTPQQAILLAFSLPVAWILLTQYLTLLNLFKHTHIKWDKPLGAKIEKPIYPQLDDSEGFYYDFYRKITTARLTENSRDIRDSYTHLREHSNSVFVVLIELNILAGLLFLHSVQDDLSPTIKVVTGIPIFWIFVLVLLGIWLVPTMFMWSLANRLELVFSIRPGDFVGNAPLEEHLVPEPPPQQ